MQSASSLEPMLATYNNLPCGPSVDWRTTHFQEHFNRFLNEYLRSDKISLQFFFAVEYVVRQHLNC